MTSNSFQREINHITRDFTHGSGVLTEHIIQAFLEHQPDQDSVRWALSKLKNMDASMNTVHHLLHEIKKAKHEDLREILETYREKWSKVAQSVSAELSSQLLKKKLTVLVHSHSSMVIRVLKELRKSDYHLSIIQTTAQPGEEGVVQAAELSGYGLDVKVIADDQVPLIVQQVDTCFLGVDHFDDHYFVNKVGSAEIIDYCAEKEIPVYILGDRRKKVKKAQAHSKIFERVRFRSNTLLITGE